MSCGLSVRWWGPVGCPPRLAPEATRNLPGVQPAVASVRGECGCRRLHSRQNPGRASPARRGEQPTSAETCALHFGPGPMQNRASETPSDPGPPRPHRDGEISPQTNHPTRTPRGSLTPSARIDPRRKVSPAPQFPARTSGELFHLEHPARSSRHNFTQLTRPQPRGAISHQTPDSYLRVNYRTKRLPRPLGSDFHIKRLAWAARRDFRIEWLARPSWGNFSSSNRTHSSRPQSLNGGSCRRRHPLDLGAPHARYCGEITPQALGRFRAAYLINDPVIMMVP